MFKIGDEVYLINITDKIPNQCGMTMREYKEFVLAGKNRAPSLRLNDKYRITHVFTDNNTCGIEHEIDGDIFPSFDCCRFSLEPPFHLGKKIPKSKLKEMIKELRGII